MLLHSIVLALAFSLLLDPVFGWLPWNTFNRGEPCFKDYNLGGCYHCSTLYNRSKDLCNDGYKARKTGEKCLLGMRCRGKCEFETRQYVPWSQPQPLSYC